MRRETATDLAAAAALPDDRSCAHGQRTALRDERILRVMIVRNEVPPKFVEQVER